ncbi:hypothetical protein Tco_0025863 [Tanacetum coccineum]
MRETRPSTSRSFQFGYQGHEEHEHESDEVVYGYLSFGHVIVFGLKLGLVLSYEMDGYRVVVGLVLSYEMEGYLVVVDWLEGL